MKKHYKRIEDMTDDEWQKRLDEVAKEMGWDETKPVFQEPDPRFTERHDGETPLGGDYSIAYYYDKDHNPCTKEEAMYVNIVIYNNDGSRVDETYGVLG